jgi:hypothetical protein
MTIIKFSEPRILFLHIPKTGGSSLEWWFKKKLGCTNYLLDHLVLGQLSFLERYIDLNDYYKFTIVRNPYDRIYSSFCHLKRANKVIVDYDQFLKNRLTTNKFVSHLRLMSDTCQDLDEVFKYERYNEMVEKLKNKFNIDGEPEVFNLNNSVNPGYQVTTTTDELKYIEIYRQNRNLVPLINELYHEDFKNLGYEMLPW